MHQNKFVFAKQPLELFFPHHKLSWGFFCLFCLVCFLGITNLPQIIKQKNVNFPIIENLAGKIQFLNFF